jgi:hypothetical protein
MSRYAALSRHLRSLRAKKWVAKFSEIESVLGSSLPKSAYKYPAWWANQAGAGHVQCNSWQDEGWITADLDLPRRVVTFVNLDEDGDVPNSPSSLDAQTMTAEHQGDGSRSGLTIAAAKRELAKTYGVTEENIEIIVRG